MPVIGTQRHESAQPPAYVERLLPHDELPQLLATADHVVLCLPLTEETRHTIGSAELGHMRRTAYLYNIGRGELIDQPALIEALQTGQIAGAGLDVTSPEPRRGRAAGERRRHRRGLLGQGARCWSRQRFCSASA
jgi:phosphoglycerate dehydrogenase-like enzyme